MRPLRTAREAHSQPASRTHRPTLPRYDIDLISFNANLSQLPHQQRPSKPDLLLETINQVLLATPGDMEKIVAEARRQFNAEGETSSGNDGRAGQQQGWNEMLNNNSSVKRVKEDGQAA